MKYIFFYPSTIADVKAFWKLTQELKCTPEFNTEKARFEFVEDFQGKESTPLLKFIENTLSTTKLNGTIVTANI